MHVFDAVASRYSCRAFLPTPVPEAIVRDILLRASRAPSGGNLQPWHVHVLAGARLGALRDIVHARSTRSIRAICRSRMRAGAGARASCFISRSA
jgi:nitroreductase